MSISAWSTTASQNGGRLVSGNYLEQQSPSTLNDAGRSVMSQIRSWANDLEWFEFGTGSNTTSYTRVSATSVSMPTNCVDQFHVNRRVKIKDGSGATVYGRVTSSAFNSPNTVLVFEFDSGSLGSGNPTSVAYGIVSATNTSLPSVVPTGTILMTGVATADSGYLICDGTAYSRTSYSALFTKIGTAFGNGDGSSTFNVPNLQSKFPMGKGSSDNIGDTNGSFTQTPTGTIATSSTFSGSALTPSGSVSVAVNNHTLTTSQIPSHAHKIFSDHSSTGSFHRKNGSSSSPNPNAFASLDYYLVSGSDDFKYSIAHGGGSPTVHPTESIGGDNGHNHSASGTFSGTAVTPSGAVSSTSTLTASVMDITNPYVALNYQIKY
tara:strand:- start:27 stop:1160 length:1134 start_codon:yes stop_codon:yes gene_type:complete